MESSERNATINGIGNAEEDDGASGDGGAGNDDAGAYDGGIDEENAPENNAEASIEMDDVESITKKMISSDETEKKRSIDDDAESDEFGPLPTLPLKRARVPYFIFADEKRKEVTQEHQGEGVVAVAKVIGQLWSALEPTEKEVYEAQAVKEKERFVRDVQRLKDAGRLPVNSAVDAAQAWEDELIFPVARIRKICKLDPDVKGISKESALLIAKATELFCSKLGRECAIMAQMQNRRKLVPGDVVEVCSAKEAFMFLRPDIIDMTKAQQADAKLKETENGKEQRAASAGEANSERNNLDSYFGKTAR
ncbi:hypothetical protein ACHAXA_009609 [Cyclostephanos tholiformis]|uniref:HMG box domain-containing protein n=1 Tax=Cyclostephanos tholiformis TaxID=382380 RepID=A0ABD3RMZ8_9STRA